MTGLLFCATYVGTLIKGRLMQFSFRVYASSLLLALLLSCGLSQTDRPAPGDGLQINVGKASFTDSDPQKFSRKAPQRYAVHGIDAARYQGAIDWQLAAGAGVSFAYLKATEGGDGLDPAFATNWQGAAQAGIPRGAFHFFYFCRPAREQAAWFIRNVPRSPGALPPVLDMEWTPFSPTCTLRPDPATVRAEAETFLNFLEQHYGQRPLIYTSPEFYATNQMAHIPRVEFWLRSVADHPSKTYPNQAWTFWQYSSTGGVAGVQGPVDTNVFAGSVAAWSAWLTARSLP
jgi:lysozyme